MVSKDITDEQLENLYSWVDDIPLSRPKKKIANDFSDGVLVAEIVKHYFPKWVELHNYTSANSKTKKETNWLRLNKKVLKNLNIDAVKDKSMDAIINCTPWAIEKFLLNLRSQIEIAKDQSAAVSTVASDYTTKSSRKGGTSFRRGYENDMPEVDQNMGPMRGVKGRGKAVRTKMEVKPPEFEKVSFKNLNRSEAQPEYNPAMLRPVGDRRYTSKDPELSLMYEEKVQDCLEKEETIKIMHAKIRRLEHLLDLKDIRLVDLQREVEHLRPTGNYKK